MNDRITAAGKLLTASKEDRLLKYRLLPYGEPGSTSIGRVTASRGSVEVPEDVQNVRLNLEHDRTRPVGTAVNITEEDEGLMAAFHIARTRAGDDLLEEAAEGLRASVSVEIDGPVVRAGNLIAGRLTGAGAVVEPAFPSALLVANDHGELPEEEEEEEAPAINDAGSESDEESEEEDEEMGDSTATAQNAAAPRGGMTASKGKTNPVQTTGDLFRLLAKAHETKDRQMLAALSDIVPGDILGVEQPQYVNELWSGKAYQRKIVPLFNHADLTSFKVDGWRWVTKPAVAAYSGNKTAVPSNTVETEPVSINAERIAGAHDIDRKFRDFKDEGFFASYYKAMTESYAKVSDAQVLADVLVSAGTAVEVGTVPTDVAEGMVQIVDGALSIISDLDVMPTFALMAPDLWRSVLLTKKDDVLAYLNAALGLEEGSMENFKIIPSASITAGHTLVGVRDAVTVHELGGESPIRVEALDVANGGVDTGVFGYYAVNTHDADGLVLIGPNTGV